ncbi:DUF4306 domain-containing protein [Bacillus sp. FJAT-42315]|uniref:DUF4306 domain-containing protein n=1 Tax=Bacillus sp. FJAT-42315 TaxID=2014077 RepID=UPI003FA48AFD
MIHVNQRLLKVIVFLLACLTFLSSMFFSWYEGSNLIEDTFESEYTAIISNYLGVIKTPHDINQLDFFIYAAKFKPFFPTVMILSLYILLFFVINRLFKEKRYISHLFLGLILLISSLSLLYGTTEGSTVFSVLFLIMGTVSLIISYMTYQKRKVIPFKLIT